MQYHISSTFFNGRLFDGLLLMIMSTRQIQKISYLFLIPGNKSNIDISRVEYP